MTETEMILIAVGEQYELKAGSFGIGRKSKLQLRDLGLSWVRNELCSKKQEILARSRTTEVEMGMVLAEILLFLIGNSIPGLPMLARLIAQIGLERFCADPTLLIKEKLHE